MAGPGWLTQSLGDVPSGEDWLGDGERRVLALLQVEPRRVDWRLGRWTAKAALGSWLSVAPARVQVLAAPDGAPEAWLDGARAPVSISLSHRGGRALALVTDAPRVGGCDLELVEPRSLAFVREWLAPSEQLQISDCAEADRALLVNLIWTAKEAAAKVRREGLRLDVRSAVVTVAAGSLQPGPWRPLQVAWSDVPTPAAGWWRAEPGWVMAVAGEPAPQAPRAIKTSGGC
jgi:4'-phosphopantetheinyl transferase